MRLGFFNIIGGISKESGAIPEEAQANITSIAQQPTDSSGYMAMIYTQLIAKMYSANSAAISLLLPEPFNGSGWNGVAILSFSLLALVRSARMSFAESFIVLPCLLPASFAALLTWKWYSISTQTDRAVPRFPSLSPICTQGGISLFFSRVSHLIVYYNNSAKENR